jgi:hypothetical protein
LGGAERVYVGRGAKFQRFDLTAGKPLPAALAASALGPSGNLRAPAARSGRTWLIGFCESAWNEAFG